MGNLRCGWCDKAAVEHTSDEWKSHVRATEIADHEDAESLKVRLLEVEKERDLALAHDRQTYPTAASYELVCKLYQDALDQRDALLGMLGEPVLKALAAAVHGLEAIADYETLLNLKTAEGLAGYAEAVLVGARLRDTLAALRVSTKAE